MNGLDNPWVLRAIPVPKPAKTHTHTVGTDFFQVGYGLLVSFCKYVPATGPQVTHGYLQKINLML